jgi:hypothetical protein
MGHLWLLLLFACASPAAVLGAIDERFVAQAASAGMSTSDIALQLGCTQRRIQQILAFLRPPSAAGPSPQPQTLAAEMPSLRYSAEPGDSAAWRLLRCADAAGP